MEFSGHVHRSIDTKGRVILPPDFKDQILKESPEGKVVLTMYDGHVIGLTPDQWTRSMREMKKVTSPGKNFKQMKRIFISGRVEVVLDSQGRLPLPAHLRKSGRLIKNKIAVLGVDERFEIWSKEEHEELLLNVYDVTDDLEKYGVELPFD